MKTQISRKTFKTKKRYSGVYQQQGRMLTDADWNEQVEIVKQRFISVTGRLVAGGAPQNGGFIHYNNDYENPAGELKWGSVVVDGISASIVPGAAAFDADFDYLNQQDFPDAPQLAGGVSRYNLPAQNDYEVYLDVWERTLNYLEDDDLRDAALQGADTCTRSQTMVQVKLCPDTIDPEDVVQNPKQGNALLSLHQRESSTSPDACDPCSREVELENNHANYLFRVEVHSVTYSGQNIDTLELKWSSENAAEQHESTDVPIGFKQDTYCYEIFSGHSEHFSSEKHSGRHFIENASDDFPKTGRLFLHDEYPPVNENELIRRWDGTIKIKRIADDNWELLSGEDRGIPLSETEKSYIEHAYVYLDGSYPGSYAQDYLGLDADDVSAEPAQQRLIINLNALIFKLELQAKAFLTGDYWCTPVRNKEMDDFDDEALLSSAEPEGIEHHYYRVAHLASGIIHWAESFWEKAPDPETSLKHRRLPFAAIDHLQANDIAYRAPECPVTSNETVLNLLNQGDNAQWLLKDQREASVQRLLDSLLCLFNASHLPLNRADSECLITQENEAGYVQAQSVQDALNNLCQNIQSLTADDIAFDLDNCSLSPEKTQSISSLLMSLPVAIEQPETVKNILMNILCDVDARHIPLYKDAALCQDLRTDSSIVSVQDAINSLCAKESNNCTNYTLEPGSNIQEIFNKVKQGGDASFCFQAGYFELPETLLLNNKANIKISGAGAATKIVVKNNKCALHILNCQQVTIRDLTIESQSLLPFINGKDEFPNGVLTLTDCNQATVEYLQLKCSSASRYMATCLTARSKKTSHVLRINSCDLITGDYQAGMLLLNATIALIEANTITVAKRPRRLTFERIASDNHTNIHLRRELVDKILINDPDVLEPSKSAKGNIKVRLGDYNVYFNSSVAQSEWNTMFKDNPSNVTDKRSKATAESYVLGVVQKTAQDPGDKTAFSKRIESYIKSGTDSTSPLSIAQRKNLIATSRPVAEDNVKDKRNVKLKMGKFEVSFNSTFSTPVWIDIINKAAPAKTDTETQINAYLGKVKKQLLNDLELHKNIPSLGAWFNGKKAQNPTAGKYGIICAGKTAGDIKIINNNIKGVTEAIRVAISNGGPTDENSSGLQIETATIANNRMSLIKPATVEIAPRAMMVGNCKHLIVENNRMIASAAAAGKAYFYEGLRVYGVLGRTLLIRQNSLANCLTGVFLKPLNVQDGDENDPWKNNLWIVSDNIFPGAKKTVDPSRVKGYDSNLL